MTRSPLLFKRRYGPWALIAGASEGLGAEFARQLAARGLNLVLVARRAELLAALGDELRAGCGVEVRALALDLGAADLAARLETAVAGLEIGLLVYNAAYSVIRPYLETSLDDKLRHVDVNVRGPLILTSLLAPAMAARGRGGIVLMSSASGLRGNELLVTYGATKAFTTALAEGLWQELQGRGVDVLATIAGSTRTPNFVASRPQLGRFLPPVQEPAQVAARTLAALGAGPVVSASWSLRLAEFLMVRLLPRRLGVRLLSNSTRSVYPARALADAPGGEAADGP
jgi:short-subunit dehydrogenase